ncbi:MAG TPA: NAD(P)H-binding protein, partial [Longimicrobiaceae bacterium]
MNILVTGGTGTLGREVVEILRGRGHTIRILTRKPASGEGFVQGDIATGTGLADAVAGIDTIVNAASATTDPKQGHATDVVGTRRLLEAASGAGVRHVVHVSIVGIERVQAVPYYRHKLNAERVVRGAGVPWTILRATQFHPLI